MTQRMLGAGASEQGRITRCSSGAAVGCLAVYLKDPNGIIVELVEPPPGDVPDPRPSP